MLIGVQQNLPFICCLIVGVAAVQFYILYSWSKTLDHEEESTVRLLQSTLGSSYVQTRRDLTQLLKAARLAVAEALKQQRAIVDQAVDVICLMDVEGRFLSVNQASTTVFGYEPEELRRKFITEFLVDLEEGALAPFLGAEKSIEKIFVENSFRKKDGKVIDLLWSAHWSASDSALYCIAHDITERKQTEKLLRESEQRIRTILENVPAGIAIVNAKGYFEFMNQEAFDVCANEGESIENLFASDVFPFGERPFDYTQFIEAAGEAHDIVSKSGERIPSQLSVSELSWNNSPAVLVIFLDLRQKYAVEKAKRQFVAMVTHDLRSPLTSISIALTYLGEVHAGSLDEKARGLFFRTANESLRLVSLINDLLDLEKMKSGRFVSNLASTDVLDLAKRSAEVVEPQAAAQGVIVEINGTECQSECDGARIIQVLVNLLDNAIRYSQPGQTVQVNIAGAENEPCMVSVRNFGRVVPKEKLTAIFESFEQINPRSAKDSKGTGLGLAICKTIIEQHGQEIRVESSKEHGTVFSFSLPPVASASESAKGESHG